MGFKDLKRLKLSGYTGDSTSCETAEAKKFCKDRCSMVAADVER
jgi:hypothetical protein